MSRQCHQHVNCSVDNYAMDMNNSLDDLIQQSFTQFGVTYFTSEVLHRSLCIAWALLSFESADAITQPRFEEKLAIAYSFTLGKIINNVQELLPEEIQKGLNEALIMRNFLAHHFWYERNYLMFSEEGLRKLLYELKEMEVYFKSMDARIAQIIEKNLQSFGISKDTLDSITKRMLNGEPDRPLIKKRPLKKREWIIKVWDVEVGDGQVTQIFETQEGILLQFADVGLSWSIFEEVGDDWKINDEIQKYLPSRVVIRPDVEKAWHYEIDLSNQAILWVKPGAKNKSYKWGIRTR